MSPKPFTATVTREDDRVTVKLTGELDLATKPIAQRAFRDAGDPAGGIVEVDAGEVTFIDSEGVSAFIRASKDISKAGGTFRVTVLADNVARVFKILRLETLFQVSYAE